MKEHAWAVTHSTDPFKHSIFDNFWDPMLLMDCQEEFLDVHPDSWLLMEAQSEEGVLLERKYSISLDRCQNLPAAKRMFNRLQEPRFIQILETITEIKGLQFDPLGGGLHRIVPGGLLRPHLDFNIDAQGRWRRVNVLIYLNSCNGGELRFYGPDKKPAKAIKPNFNRMVVFECTERSWHGHPVPLGEGPDRRSVAAYYFTSEPSPDAAEPHSTLFLKTEQD